MGMYLRRTQRRRRDGSVVGYLQLAHNGRVDGVTQAEVLLNLGREDQLDVEGLRRLARSISRYTDAADGVGAAEASAGTELRATDARPFGAAWVLDALWRQLGVDRALDSVLASADAEGKVQEAVFFSVADLLNLEVDLLFFDTTSSYFEIEDEDEEGEEGGEALRRFGHSKDHRSDRPQVVIGLAVTRTGIPVRVWVWPGNTADQAVIAEVKDDLAGWRLGRCVWVVDRGLSSEENLRYLRRGGGHWIAGQRMRSSEPARHAALARQGRYREVRDNLRVKDVRLGEGDTQRRFIVCHNSEEAQRDRARRERALERIEAELERIERLRARAGKTGTAHERAECALRDHPSHSRYLRQLPSGRLRIDRAEVDAEQRLEGKFLLETSDPDISAEDAALGYKNLLEAERSFRDLKGTLRIRPVYHRLEERIRAHIVICWLAPRPVRPFERQA